LLASLIEDVTDRMQAAAAQQQLRDQQAIIRSQQESLLELSTPLIPITDTVVAMPLIGALDSRRAQQVLTTLLDGIVETRATVAILDITGVPIVDTQVANALIQAAQAVKLLGAQVVLTGIRPEVAQTLIGLGVQLGDIITMSNLQAGISYATRKEPARGAA
jgi:anti-anti-sigma regulatory factor